MTGRGFASTSSPIRVSCGEYGADPSAGMLNALMYGEFHAARHLLKRGARMNLITAAAFGDVAEVQRAVPVSNEHEKRLALALAAQHGHMMRRAP